MKARILVVDDDRLVADTLCLVYQSNGFESEARYSAAEGYERARDFSPDLILCDITMPEESGLELADRLLASMPSTRMLLLTAYASNLHCARLHTSRAQRAPIKVLSKPCRPDDLLRETRALLEVSRSC